MIVIVQLNEFKTPPTIRYARMKITSEELKLFEKAVKNYISTWMFVIMRMKMNPGKKLKPTKLSAIEDCDNDEEVIKILVRPTRKKWRKNSIDMQSQNFILIVTIVNK